MHHKHDLLRLEGKDTSFKYYIFPFGVTNYYMQKNRELHTLIEKTIKFSFTRINKVLKTAEEFTLKITPKFHITTMAT